MRERVKVIATDLHTLYDDISEAGVLTVPGVATVERNQDSDIGTDVKPRRIIRIYNDCVYRDVGN